MKAGEQIVFLYVADLDRSTTFYRDVLGFPLVLDQGSCRIFQSTATSYVGVCTIRPEKVGVAGALLTFVTEDVDVWHDKLVAAGTTITRGPQSNPDYQIYNFFAEDPDGNHIEVQRFDSPDWKVADA